MSAMSPGYADWLRNLDAEIRRRDAAGHYADLREEFQPEWRKFSIVPHSDLLLTRDGLRRLGGIQWLVDRLISTHSIGGLGGDSGEGKTFLALAIACSIVTGRELITGFKPMRKGNVIFMAGEGQHGLQDRLDTLVTEYDLDGDEIDDGILFTSQMLPLRNPTDANLTTVLDLVDQLGKRYELVIFDNYAQMLDDVNENDNTGGVQNIKAARAFVDRLGAAGLILGHLTKESGKWRGAGSVRAAFDFLFIVESQNGLRCVRVDKEREAESGARIPYAIETRGESAVAVSGTELPPPQNGKGMSMTYKDVLEAMGSKEWTVNKLKNEMGANHAEISSFLKQMEKRKLVSKRASGERDYYTAIPQQ